MCSIFSKYLTPIGVNDESEKPSVIYNHLRIAYNQGARGIINNTRMFSSDDLDEEDIMYETWHNDALCALIQWVNKKIVLQIGVEKYETLLVRTAIFSRCLNSIVEKEYMLLGNKVYYGSLSKRKGIMLHQNFVNNLWREFSAIKTEDLPF